MQLPYYISETLMGSNGQMQISSPEPRLSNAPAEDITPAGRVIWITGLSGAGKTTLAKALLPLLPQPRLLLDGDELRESLALLAGGYECEDRLKLAMTYARLAGLAAEQGQSVVCATISLFHAVQAWNRENLPGYFEVFLDVPEAVRKQRDYKKVYQAKTAIVGKSFKPELPLSADLRINSNSVSEAAQMIANIVLCVVSKRR
jgi:adenylylsulfate kinase